MRAVVQRVTGACVTSGGEIISGIGYGLMILLGIHQDDNDEDMDWLVNKTTGLRIFDDENCVMNLDVIQSGCEIMVVSQFTLQASTKKGNRPSYIAAMEPVKAEAAVEKFVLRLEEVIKKPIATGVFGAHMKISLVNDGPVTIILDSKNKDL
ncbi:D-aminoacyl-tRNA deacylase [bioreactor metagenome]|uniref:D-aminoacyl-tRNA deacylase n=1 Tax=bioreactor metagenome TaxID=1076179 RepID=A0A644Y876_9ZZZZ